MVFSKTLRFICMVFLLVAAAAVHYARAEESESRIKAKELTQEAKEHNDVDIMIKNKQLRAGSGSKSLWSIGTSFSYSGGSVRKPLAEDRPNIAGTTATTDKALLDGAIDLKYNIAAQHSLSAGVGVRWIAPLSSGSPKNYDGERVDAANPFITYQYLYNFAGMESVVQVQPIFYTESNLIALGYSSALLLNQDSVYELGTSGLSVGFSAWVQYGLYNKKSVDGVDVRGEQSDYLLGVSPLLEYVINGTFNLRTVSNLWNYEHLRSQTAFNTYKQDKITQSFGLGISLDRDVFVYPNIQFVPEDIRADRTNLGVSADVNIF